MKTYLPMFIALLVSVSGCKGNQEESGDNQTQGTTKHDPDVPLDVADKLVLTEGIWLLKETSQPYSGKIFKRHESRGHEEKLAWSGAVKKGQKHGVWTTYQVDGQKSDEATWVDGKLDGIHTLYREDGGTWSTNPYKNGKRHGVKVSYYPSGAKQWVTPYEKGKIHGVEILYAEDGKKRSETTYKKGKMHGLLTSYLKDGTKEQECQYTNGVQGECKKL